MQYTNFEEEIRLKYRRYLLSELKNKFGDEVADEYIKGFDENYIRIICDTPDDGGVNSPNHHNIPEAVAVVAFFLASQKKFGVSGTIEVFKQAMQENEKFEIECKKTGKEMFTKEWQDNRKKQAKNSLNNTNGFQLRFVEGNITEYFGVDYLKCPIVEILKRENVKELQVAMCGMDYFLAEHMGFVLERTKTIGTGDDCCDFRYFKKHEITNKKTE